MREFTQSPLLSKKGVDGEITFYGRTGQELVPITDINGNALENPQPITDGLLFRQVFLPDVDVRWEISKGDRVIRTGYSLKPTVSFNIETLTCVGSIAELSAREANDGDLVVTTGYYEKGDRDLIPYVFSTSSSAEEDGGSVIAGEGGKWIIADITSDCVDSMIFGVRGSATMSDAYDAEWNANIAPLASYAQSIGKQVSFNTSKGKYIYLANGAYNVGGNAILFSNGNVTVTIGENVEIVDSASMHGTFHIKGSYLKTSQLELENSTYSIDCEKLSVDSSMSLDVKNMVVSVETSLIHPCTFTNCTVNSNGAISCNVGSPMQFFDCHVSASMFDNSFNIAYLSCTRCMLNEGEWLNGYHWYRLNNGRDIIDMYGKTCSTTITDVGNKTFKNGTFTNVSGTNITFEKCSVANVSATTVTLRNTTCTTTNAQNIVAYDSDVGFTKTNSVNLYARDSNLRCGSTVDFSTVDMVDCTMPYTSAIHITSGKVVNVPVDVHSYCPNMAAISNLYLEGVKNVNIYYISKTSTNYTDISLTNVHIHNVVNINMDVAKFYGTHSDIAIDGITDIVGVKRVGMVLPLKYTWTGEEDYPFIAMEVDEGHGHATIKNFRLEHLNPIHYAGIGENYDVNVLDLRLRLSGGSINGEVLDICKSGCTLTTKGNFTISVKEEQIDPALFQESVIVNKDSLNIMSNINYLNYRTQLLYSPANAQLWMNVSVNKA